VLTSVRSDYRVMENMILGEVPDFEEILVVLQALKEETNTPSGKMETYFSEKILIMVFFMVSTSMTTGKPAPVLAFRGLFTIEWE